MKLKKVWYFIVLYEGVSKIGKDSIHYKVSLYCSKFLAYQSKNGKQGTIKLFITNIWNDTGNYNRFVAECIYIILLERICLERGMQKIKMKNRCSPYKGFACKMDYIANKIIKMVYNN